MSGQRRRSVRRGHSTATDRLLRAAVALFLCAFLAGVVLTVPVLAQDETPPAFGTTTIVNETTFEVVLEDDGGVDEGSIGKSDFSLSTGTIDRVGVNESGNASVATVYLAQPVRSANTTLHLDESIADDAGNEMTDGRVTVAGIDGFPPFLKEYEVSWTAPSRVEIAFYVDEPLGDATVTIKGRESGVLGLGEFTETDTQPANEYRYATNYTFDAEDDYTITLESVEDAHSNVELYFADREVVHDLTDPTARVNGPTTATVGKAITFEGADSSDETRIESFEWVIDGNVTSANESITHTFEESGSHEVALTVADGRNNTHAVRHPIEVLHATTAVDVAISPTNGTGVDVVIGPNRTKQRVLVEGSGGLGGNGTTVLDSLILTVPTNATANLSTAASTGAPGTFDVPDGATFETLDLQHEGASVSDVTFRFSVRRSALENASVPLDGVSLYREHEGWTRLPTLRVGGNDTHVQYRATSPGLSRFVIAGSDEPIDDGTGDGGGGDEGGASDGTAADGGPAGGTDGEPAFAVVDGRLLTRNVSAGEPVVVRATITNDGSATGTYVAGVSVGETVLRTTEVTIPVGESREVTIAEPVASGGVVAVNGTRVGSVALAGGSAAAGSVDDGGGGGLPIPDPLALWPGGLVGRVLGAIFWLVLVVFGILKGLAIYLGY